MKDLKAVYKAPIEDLALTNLGIFEEKWGRKYPMCVNSWKNNWTEISTYFKYPEGIRKLIYTTNAMENFNRQLRKVTKIRQYFQMTMPYKKACTLQWKMPQVNGQVEYVVGIKSYPNYQYFLKGGSKN